MSDQGDDLLTSTGSDNQHYVEKCLQSLHSRVSILEETAKSQAEDLRRADSQWKLYRDQVTELHQRLANTQKLVLAPSSTQSLDLLMSNNQVIGMFAFIKTLHNNFLLFKMVIIPTMQVLGILIMIFKTN